MKKWLLLAGLAAAAAYAAQKLLSAQACDSAVTVTKEIFDDVDAVSEAPVETAAPPLDCDAPPVEMADAPGVLPSEDENA